MAVVPGPVTPEQARTMTASRLALSVIGGYRLDVARMTRELLEEVLLLLPANACEYRDFVHTCECQVCGARWDFPKDREPGADVHCVRCLAVVRLKVG